MALPVDIRPASPAYTELQAAFGAPRVYTPSDFREDGTGGIDLDVHLDGRVATLPVENVGTPDNQVWIAYANVLTNTSLRYAAHLELVKRVKQQLKLDPNIRTIIVPPSQKTQGFFADVYASVAHQISRPLEYIQLIGGTDQEWVSAHSAPGLWTECNSVVSQARGVRKFIGMTPEQYSKMLRAGGKVLFLDDIRSTGVSIEKMHEVVNFGLGVDPKVLHTTHVIGFESIYDGNPTVYPPNVFGAIHLPEVVGPLS